MDRKEHQCKHKIDTVEKTEDVLVSDHGVGNECKLVMLWQSSSDQVHGP
jgi:hypothetical protein